MILAVKENPGAQKNEIAGAESAKNRTKFLRINEMIELGLIEVSDGKLPHNAMRLYLTPEGQRIAKKLDDLAKLSIELGLSEDEEIV